MVLYIKTETAERKEKSIVIPFSSISFIEFEYGLNEQGIRIGELSISYNSNCADTVISESDVKSLNFIIIEDGASKNKFESDNVEEFEEDFTEMMTRYMKLINGELID